MITLDPIKNDYFIGLMALNLVHLTSFWAGGDSVGDRPASGDAGESACGERAKCWRFRVPCIALRTRGVDDNVAAG
jgi:hypothetical protein